MAELSFIEPMQAELAAELPPPELHAAMLPEKMLRDCRQHTSQDDFGVNDAGLMITETTITQFEGWDPNGKPEFVRSRKALLIRTATSP